MTLTRDRRTELLAGCALFSGLGADQLAAVAGLPRVAQVVAELPTRCLAIASWDFERVLLDRPALTLSILRDLAGRLRSVTEQQHHH